MGSFLFLNFLVDSAQTFSSGLMNTTKKGSVSWVTCITSINMTMSFKVKILLHYFLTEYHLILMNSMQYDKSNIR